MNLNLSMFLNWLSENYPQFLADFITVADKFIDTQLEGIELPEGDTENKGRRNWLDNPLDGEYDFEVSGITDEQLEAIRQGIADGQINERMGSFLKGFLAALQVAG